jgi:hypothetical protein
MAPAGLARGNANGSLHEKSASAWNKPLKPRLDDETAQCGAEKSTFRMLNEERRGF